MRSLCVIPARGGSKRIPRKNIRDFLGKPIITDSIEAARDSSAFDTVMVATDDEEIAAVARDAGAEVPFLRSGRTSDDQTGLAAVLLEVLEEYARRATRPELVGCILPTAPLVRSSDVAEAVRLVEADPDTDAVVPIVRFGYPIQRALELDGDGNVSMVWPEHESSRSQDLSPRYHDAGQYYVITAQALHSYGTLFPASARGVELPEARVQDIDTEEDWLLAQLKYQLADNSADVS